jgi:hypothetical protein
MRYFLIALLCLAFATSTSAQSVLPYRVGRLHGLADSNGNVVVSPQFTELDVANCGNHNLYIARKDSNGATYSYLLDGNRVLCQSDANNFLSALQFGLFAEYGVDTNTYSYKYALRNEDGTLLFNSACLGIEVVGSMPSKYSYESQLVKGLILVQTSNAGGKKSLWIYDQTTKKLEPSPAISADTLQVNLGFSSYDLEYSGDTNFSAYHSVMEQDVLSSDYYYDLPCFSLRYNKNGKNRECVCVLEDKKLTYLSTQQFCELLLSHYKSYTRAADTAAEKDTEVSERRAVRVQYYSSSKDNTYRRSVNYEDRSTVVDKMPSDLTVVHTISNSIIVQAGDTTYEYNGAKIVQKDGRYGVYIPFGPSLACQYDSIVYNRYYSSSSTASLFVVGVRNNAGLMKFGIVNPMMKTLVALQYDSIMGKVQAADHDPDVKMARKPSPFARRKNKTYEQAESIMITKTGQTYGYLCLTDTGIIQGSNLDSAWLGGNTRLSAAQEQHLSNACGMRVDVVFKKNGLYGCLYSPYYRERYTKTSAIFTKLPIAVVSRYDERDSTTHFLVEGPTADSKMDIILSSGQPLYRE